MSEVTWHKTNGSDIIKCSGIRRIRTKRPKIDIELSRDVMKWPGQPPSVWCTAPWVRRDINWHVFSDSKLCWCLNLRWLDVQGWPCKSRDAIATDGLNWLFSSVDLLLTRHLVGHYRNLDKWPEEWTAWGHGEDGIQEYEQQPIRRIRRRRGSR